MTKTLHKIKEIVDKLSRGSLTEEELHALVTCTAELHEKALILRYKAYETKIFGATITEHVSIPTPAELAEKKIEIPTVPVEEKHFEETIEEDIAEAPAFDLSLFNEVTEEEETVEQTIEEEEALKTEAIVEEEIPSEEKDLVLDESFDTQELVEEHEDHEESLEEVFTQETIVETLAESHGSELLNQEIATDSIAAKYAEIEPGFFSQLGTTKLDQLVGSFGLNERLQFINELFDGSSEAFSENIKKLDAMGSYRDALGLIANLAAQFNWEADSETVEEFITKIKRRHG